MEFTPPTTKEIKNIVKKELGFTATSVKRFTTGRCHYVYDIKADEKDLVIRIANPSRAQLMESAIIWYNKLKPLGIPLAKIYYEDVKAEKYPFNFYIMERLSGTDLMHVYTKLNKEEKEAIAKEVVKMQNIVAKLPQEELFGEFFTPDYKITSKTWFDFINKEDSVKKDFFDPKYVDILQQELLKHKKYFDKVKPTPFLDDLTVKNVIIDENNKLSGVVDIDYMTYGDKIFNLGLINMGLLYDGFDTDYVNMIAKEYKMNKDEYKALYLYTLSCCIEFMSSINKKTSNGQTDIDKNEVEHLENIFNNLLKRIT